MSKPTKRAPAGKSANTRRSPHAQGREGSLQTKRERFEEAGRFPAKKVAVIGVVVFVALVAVMIGFDRYEKSRQVGGVQVATAAAPAAAAVASKTSSENLIESTQDAQNVTFSLGSVQQQGPVQVGYKRTAAMPADYQALTGGNNLPLLAYVSPAGKLVVATSFCEPCRGTSFHIEGPYLVCDKCFTRWDLNTLEGVSGGCTAFPPEQVAAEVQGDKVVVAAAQLEAWQPRAQ